MSIKSEKAKEYIAKNRVSPRIGEDGKIDGFIRIGDGSFMYADSAQIAVELAESDARERAVRAFKESCVQYHPGEGCHKGLAVFSLCQPERCQRVQNFLRHYDNEQ